MKLQSTNNRLKNEYLVLIYRLILIMAFYSLFRILFYLFNASLFPNVTTSGFLTILKGGLMFDLSAMLYLNALYILFYTLPLPFKFKPGYQAFLKITYLVINGIGFALNSIDLIYFRFILKRTTYNVFDILKNESNMLKLWGQFLLDYWYIAFLFLGLMWLLNFCYSWYRPKAFQFSNCWYYPVLSILVLALFSGFTVIGIRGGYRHSTRPINMSNAGKYVNSPDEMALVLNTPFSVIRTWGKANFTSYDYFKSEKDLKTVYSPIKKLKPHSSLQKKNVVIFILESFNREFIGILNSQLDNGNYKGYTPFLDSLINHSFVFPNAFANGQKSIDAMPSILASIPSLVLPYIVSEYSSNTICALPSLLNKYGYETAFFHGAHNGSMGFDSFAKIAGFQKYHGLNEYNNTDDFDGMWGIWDEPFFQFYAEEMNKMKEPFMTSLFSLSSHHPYKIPENYDGMFPKGTLPVHQGIGYTDHALRKFFDKAKTMPWYKNTLFVITADHSTASHYDFSKTSLNKFQIPLLFFSPGDTSLAGISDDIAQQIDIMPTILSYLGHDKPTIAYGNNLLNRKDDRFVINYTNNCYQMLKDKHLIHFDGRNLISFFDIEEDPWQKHNLKESQSKPENLYFLKAFIQQYNNRMIEDRLTIKND